MNGMQKSCHLTESRVSEMRDRNSALAILIPKILGILAARGQKLHELPGNSVQLNGQTELSASFIDADRIMLSAYHPTGQRIVKVLSAHVTDTPSDGDPSFYRHQNGMVAIMGWRRGSWEDSVMAEIEKPLSIREAFASGLLRIDTRPH
jgi:hypothetical protein